MTTKKKMGKPKYIETPCRLAELFEAYKQWVQLNPWIIDDFVGKDGKRVERKKQIPLTWFSFEKWLRDNQILCELSNYLSNKDDRYSDYAPIIRAIKNEIYDHKYIGAVVGAFQQNIIARDLGLVEKQHTTFTEEITVKTSEEKIPQEIKDQYEKD